MSHIVIIRLSAVNYGAYFNIMVLCVSYRFTFFCTEPKLWKCVNIIIVSHLKRKRKNYKINHNMYIVILANIKIFSLIVQTSNLKLL